MDVDRFLCLKMKGSETYNLKLTMLMLITDLSLAEGIFNNLQIRSFHAGDSGVKLLNIAVESNLFPSAWMENDFFKNLAKFKKYKISHKYR